MTTTSTAPASPRSSRSHNMDRHIRRLALLIVTVAYLQLIFLSSRIPPLSLSSSFSVIIDRGDGDDRRPSPTIVDNRIDNVWSNTSTAAVRQQKPTPSESHAIPKILVFTHYKDLLHASSSDGDEVAAAAAAAPPPPPPPRPALNEEEQVLAANIRQSIQRHPDVSQVRFLLDEDCTESLQRVFPSLVPFFQNESIGMYKADMCRGAALYETGGIYLDVDVGVRHDLWRDLKPSTEFVTSVVHRQSKYPGHFFQAMMGSAPHSPILLRYLRLFEKHYTSDDNDSKDRILKGPLGVILLKRAWDYVQKMHNNHHNNNNNNSAHAPPTELYQEVLYHPQLFPDLHPAPTWGTRRACHFVVVAKVNHQRNKEVTTSKGIDLQIPMYSRVAGSRMCPTNNNAQQLEQKISGN